MLQTKYAARIEHKGTFHYLHYNVAIGSNPNNIKPLGFTTPSDSKELVLLDTEELILSEVEKSYQYDRLSNSLIEIIKVTRKMA